MADKVYYFNITYRCNNSCLFCAADLSANDNEQEIPIDALISFLDVNNVEKTDRVIVNGGEPTVHKDFYRFLEAINARGAMIDLFTNGKKFRDIEFASKILELQPMLIRIPLFGAKAEVHDWLTGVPGNYASTITAIDNILRLKKGKKIELELKLLLSKATVKENEKIFDYIVQKYPFEDYYFSLNPLLVSNCVVKHGDLFLEDYTSLIYKSKNLIEKAQRSHHALKMDLIPFCAFPSDMHSFISVFQKNEKIEYYTDPNQSYIVDLDPNEPGCNNCIYNRECNHYPDNYLLYMGRREIRPFYKK